jgi:hypothetical protein
MLILTNPGQETPTNTPEIPRALDRVALQTDGHILAEIEGCQDRRAVRVGNRTWDNPLTRHTGRSPSDPVQTVTAGEQEWSASAMIRQARESRAISNPDERAKTFWIIADSLPKSQVNATSQFRLESGNTGVLDLDLAIARLLSPSSFRLDNPSCIRLWDDDWLRAGIVFLGQIVEDATKANEAQNLQWPTSIPRTHQRRVSEAPPWLVRRMETLRRMPRPTLQEVDSQWKAAAEARKKLIAKPPASSSGPERGTLS